MGLASLLAAVLVAVQPAADLVPFTSAPAPRDAVAYAAADIINVGKLDQPFQRYIWVPEPTKEKVAGLVYTLNTISRSSIIYRPVVLHRGALVRVDIRKLAPREEDFGPFRDTWEELALHNPFFNTTRKVNKVVVVKTPQPPKSTVVREVKNGRYVNVTKSVPQPDLIQQTTQEVTVSEFSLHTGMHNMLLLHSLTGVSKAPIVRYETFVLAALTVLDNGLYYDFVGIGASKDRTQNDLDFLLGQIGTSRKEIERLDSDNRMAMFRSGVTGKPRRVIFWNGSGVRPVVGSSLVTLTDDFRAGNFDPLQHPVKSLASRKANAHEAVFMRANGFLGAAITDGDGKLAKEVPPDITPDHTIPGTVDKRLEPILSCLCCHGPNDGFQPVRNDVIKLHEAFRLGADAYQKLRVFDDEQSKLNVPETLEQLSGQFSGDAERTAFRQARNDHQKATWIATGGSGVAECTSAIRSVRDVYRYGAVTPKSALRDMGYIVETEADAVQLFNQVVPFTPSNRFGIRTEDPVVASLRAYNPADPIEIRHFEWEPIYPDVMIRARTKELSDSIPTKGNEP